MFPLSKRVGVFCHLVPPKVFHSHSLHVHVHSFFDCHSWSNTNESTHPKMEQVQRHKTQNLANQLILLSRPPTRSPPLCLSWSQPLKANLRFILVWSLALASSFSLLIFLHKCPSQSLCLCHNVHRGCWALFNYLTAQLRFWFHQPSQVFAFLQYSNSPVQSSRTKLAAQLTELSN